MNLNKDIEIIDLALWLNQSKTLIIADLHIGLEEALTKQGILIPKFHFKDIVLRLEKILNIINKKINNSTNKNTNKKIKNIVINGDLKHEFGTISDEEWRNTLKILDLLSRNCEKIILIRGNHDKILSPIAEKRNLEIVEYHQIDDILIIHGYQDIKNIIKHIESANKRNKGKIKVKAKIKTIIIAHEHPAISIRDSARSETFKCFLVGKYERRNLIVMPSMNLLTEGTDITREQLLSPILKKSNLKKFRALIVADKIYDFGEVKKWM